jgi:hypothetical protein
MPGGVVPPPDGVMLGVIVVVPPCICDGSIMISWGWAGGGGISAPTELPDPSKGWPTGISHTWPGSP